MQVDKLEFAQLVFCRHCTQTPSTEQNVPGVQVSEQESPGPIGPASVPNMRGGMLSSKIRALNFRKSMLRFSCDRTINYKNKFDLVLNKRHEVKLC